LTSKNLIISWVILLSLMIVWGSSFILIKKSLDYFSPLEVGLLRVTITFLALLPFALSRIKLADRRTTGYIIISGLTGSLVPAILFAIAQTQIDSGVAGTLNALTPLFTLILGVSFFRLKTRLYNIIGVFVGLTGAVGLIYVSGDHGFVFNLKYAFLIILATICYAFNVNLIKAYLNNLDALSITVLTFFYLGIPLLVVILFFTDIPHKLTTDPANFAGLGYLSVLAVVGTGIALVAFNKLIKMTSPVFASSVTYMIPVVAILWGVIDGEKFKPAYFFWFLLIIAGIVLVNANPSRKYNVVWWLVSRRNKKEVK